MDVTIHSVHISVGIPLVEASWNVMSHAQKPDFVFRRNGWVHLNWRGRRYSRSLAAEVCASALTVGSNAGYTMFRGSDKGTGYPLHSPVFPSLPLPCVTVCNHISTGVYKPTFELCCSFKRRWLVNEIRIEWRDLVLLVGI